MSGALYRSFHAPDFLPQTPCDAAVVIPSILRPSLAAALHSVFAQRFAGRIHVLVGIDCPARDGPPDVAALEQACASVPGHCLVQFMWPGYSTSVRHGGLGRARDGGMLRAVLTLLANAALVAYLDDDNIWAPEHLATLHRAIAGQDYAYSLRWYAHHATMRPIAIDRWESVGPGAGIDQAAYGGFIDPNTLMLNRERCREAIMAWTTPQPGDAKAMSADRMVFARLRHLRGAGTGQATAIYRLDPADANHTFRVAMMDGYEG